MWNVFNKERSLEMLMSDKIIRRNSYTDKQLHSWQPEGDNQKKSLFFLGIKFILGQCSTVD